MKTNIINSAYSRMNSQVTRGGQTKRSSEESGVEREARLRYLAVRRGSWRGLLCFTGRIEAAQRGDTTGSVVGRISQESEEKQKRRHRKYTAEICGKRGFDLKRKRREAD